MTFDHQSCTDKVRVFSDWGYNASRFFSILGEGGLSVGRTLQNSVNVLLFAALATLGGHAASLKVGDKAPDFSLPDQTGKQIKLSDFVGKKNVVLAFYVLAFTGG